MDYENNQEYQELVTQWSQYKHDENYAKNQRLEVERKITDITKGDLKESGTNNFPDGLKIITGFNQNVDQDDALLLKKEIDDARKALQIHMEVSNDPHLEQEHTKDGELVSDLTSKMMQEFPFNYKFTVDNKSLKDIQKIKREYYINTIAPIITETPKKPSFSVKN